jgi:hypothetical protein
MTAILLGQARRIVILSFVSPVAIAIALPLIDLTTGRVDSDHGKAH